MSYSNMFGYVQAAITGNSIMKYVFKVVKLCSKECRAYAPISIPSTINSFPSSLTATTITQEEQIALYLLSVNGCGNSPESNNTKASHS
jgi:hypothetical protein